MEAKQINAKLKWTHCGQKHAYGDSHYECEIHTQEELEEQLVDIEEYLPDEAYIQESVQLKEETKTLPDRYMKGRPGSPEYSANEKRREREAQYRKLANIDKDFEITADNINRWAFNRVCSDFRCDPERFKAELLKQPYTGLERYEED